MDKECVSKACDCLSWILSLHGRSLEGLGFALRAVEYDPVLQRLSRASRHCWRSFPDYSEVCDESDTALVLKPDDYFVWESRLYYFTVTTPTSCVEAIFGEFVRWGDRSLRSRGFPLPTTIGRWGGVCVGYVSPDFRRHSTRFFFKPLFSHHDRSRFELYAYANVSREREDGFTDEYRGMFDHWRDIRGLRRRRGGAGFAATASIS